MMAKQIITDIVVVIILPLLLIGGYYSFKSEDGALLSLASPSVAMVPGDGGQELGVKTTTALELLRSIPRELDQSLFNDPAYLMLKDYQVTIPTIPLGRVNPFTPPSVLVNLSRSARASNAATAHEVAPNTPSSSAKLDFLNKSLLK